MRLLVTGGSGFIGTNLVQATIEREIPVLNLDWNSPLDSRHTSSWRYCDILDREAVSEYIEQFQPSHLVHLAARTDVEEENDIDLYRQNTDGTRFVLEAAARCKSLERVIVTSTQFVCKPEHIPARDDEFSPFTLYGESKVQTEMLTRNAALRCCWTIIRPTTIWGPWSLRYRDGFLRMLERGLYAHPSGVSAVRSYGYVGNVISQIESILTINQSIVEGKVFYVGDKPLRLADWVNEFSRQLTGKSVRVVPRSVLKTVAAFGDLMEHLGVNAPIRLSRYRSMTEDYVTPMDRTISALGAPPISLEEGVRRTLAWYSNGSRSLVSPGLHIPRGR